MPQQDYEDFILKTKSALLDYLNGNEIISANERYFIEKYVKQSVLDIGCGFGTLF
jgi:2-polyprenyl-3-methyl-5-hydroxy-6-metoxy-1,4-benzoquinol methylase